MLLDAIVDYMPSPVDIPPISGVHPKTGNELIREASDEEASGVGVQDYDGSVCWETLFFPCIFGYVNVRIVRVQRNKGQTGAHRPHLDDARQPPIRC